MPQTIAAYYKNCLEILSTSQNVLLAMVLYHPKDKNWLYPARIRTNGIFLLLGSALQSTNECVGRLREALDYCADTLEKQHNLPQEKLTTLLLPLPAITNHEQTFAPLEFISANASLDSLNLQDVREWSQITGSLNQHHS